MVEQGIQKRHSCCSEQALDSINEYEKSYNDMVKTVNDVQLMTGDDGVSLQVHSF